MVTWARVQLLVLTSVLLLSLVAWPAQAGTQENPEVTDDEGDPEVQGVFPLGLLPIVSPGVDLIKGWVDNETATDLVFAIEVAGEVTELSPLFTYDFAFNVLSNGTTYTASAHWAGSFAAGGVATAVAAEGAVLRFTVPKAAIQAFRGDALTGFFLTTEGTLVTSPLESALDRAPDTGTSAAVYNVTQGFARGGSETDVDGDGLLDAWETQHFGGIDAENGTGDPDMDGLNNTAEQAAGTKPMDPDTDGDFISDSQDPFPLDPNRPTDFDGDGLPDAWERQHFTSIDAQDGNGDPDADGLNNTRENQLGTDPNKADTDGDGVEDADDTAPLDASAGAASTGDGAREAEPELYAGAAMFAMAATFILLGLAKGL